MPDAPALPSAADLLDARYARLRVDPDAPGWFSKEVLPGVLDGWRGFLAPWLDPHRWERKTAAELGCGAGNLALELAALGWSVTGFDVSPQAVAWAEERAADARCVARFALLDLSAPFDPETEASLAGRFDLAIDSNLLHYILPPRRAAYLANVRTLLAPGGVLAVSTSVGQPAPKSWPNLGYDPATRLCRHGDVPMTYCAEESEVRAELAAAGLPILRSDLCPAKGADESDALFIAARKRS